MAPPLNRSDTQALLAQSAWLQGLARSLIQDPDAADDLAQDACLAALESRPDADRPLRGWLATVARNALRRRARGESRRREREAVAARPERLDSTAALVERLSVHRAVVRAVAALPEAQREVVLLRYFEDCPPSAIARRLGLPASTVKTRIARALQSLRTALDDEVPDGRERWVGALLPIAAASRNADSPAFGALLVSTQTKLAAILVVLLVAAFAAHRALDGAGGGAAGAETPTPRDDLARAVLESGGPAAIADAGAADAPDARREVAGAAEAVVERGAEPATATPEPTGELWTLRGAAYWADGRPAADIELALNGSDGAAAGEPVRTAADGTFELRVAPRDGLIEAVGEDLVTVFRGSLAHVQRDAHLVVVVAPRCALAGVVVDAAGAPLEGAEVELAPPPGLRGRFGEIMDHSSLATWSALTSADGRFEIPAAPDLAGAALEARLALHEPTTVELPRGGDVGLVLRLARVDDAGRILDGRVVDAVGRPVEGATVSLGLERTESDGAGRFRFDLDSPDSPNRFAERRFGEPTRRLIAVHEGHLPARLELDVDDAGALRWERPLELRLGSAPRSIAGRVVDERGAPLADVEVWIADGTLLSIGEGGTRLLESVLAGDPDDDWPRVRTDASGSFELQGLDERDYTLTACDSDRLLLTHHGPVAAGSRGVAVVLDGGAMFARVAGRVVSRAGDPVPGVRIHPQLNVLEYAYAGAVIGTRHRGTEGVVTGEDGRFELLGVASEHVYLRLDGEGIVSAEPGRGLEGGIAALASGDVEELELVVGLRTHVRVTLGAPGDGDAVGFLDDEGRPVTINVISGGSRREGPTAALIDGVTDVLTVTDDTRTVVLYDGEREVRRQPVELVGGVVNELDL